MPASIGRLSWDTSRSSFSTDAVCQAKGITFAVNEIAYVQDVFSIRLNFTISGSQLKTLAMSPFAAWRGPLPVDWRSAGTLCDDLDNHYLICYHVLNVSCVFSQPEHLYSYNLRLSCYP